MPYQFLLYEKAGQIARLTLNRPEKLNAIHDVMRRELRDALDAAAEDDDLKVLVLKGAGRAFCAGHDLEATGRQVGFTDEKSQEEKGRRPSQRSRLKRDRWVVETWQRLLYHPKITIAQVHGHCLGGGNFLQMCCDLSIAAEDAQLGHPEYRLIGPRVIALQVLMLGLKRASYMVYTGKRFSGKEAEAMGLISKAVPADHLEAEVNELAEALSTLPADGIAIGKEMTHIALETLGMGTGFLHWMAGHTLGTNLRFEPGEFNLFKERRDKGAKTAFTQRHKQFEATEKDQA